MSPTTPRRRIARRSTVGTALTAVVALVGSVLLGVATALPAQAHEGHGHVPLDGNCRPALLRDSHGGLAQRESIGFASRGSGVQSP